MMMFSFLNDLCLGMDENNRLVMEKRDLGDDTQIWTWEEGHSFISKSGYALDVEGGSDERGEVLQ